MFEREEIIGALWSYLEAHEPELIEFTCDLIASPSMNPPGDERAMVDTLLRRMESLGLTGAQVKSKKPERPNLLYRLCGQSGKPVLMLNGHLDTKPVGNRDEWHTDPLTGTIIDGKLYGLGVGDVKAALAAMVYAAAALVAVNAPLAGDLLLCFSADEEGGSAYGADFLVENKLVQADAAVLGEPSGVLKEWESIGLLSRGITCFRTKVYGTQMHSSISEILPSVNASVKMANVMSRMKRDLRIRQPQHPLCPKGVTVNVGVIVKGGVFWGVYPGFAEFGTDIRVLPGMKQEDVAYDLEDFLDELRREDPELKVEIEFERPPLSWIEASEIAPDAPVVKALVEASARVFGAAVPLGACPATTDAPKFQLRGGIPTIPAFGPGRLPLVHSPNEHIAVASILQAAKVYALGVLNFLGA